jgi:hypothetical protein
MEMKKHQSKMEIEIFSNEVECENEVMEESHEEGKPILGWYH